MGEYRHTKSMGKQHFTVTERGFKKKKANVSKKIQNITCEVALRG